jgi:hypothetical protein
MTVTLHELTLYAERRLHDLNRLTAVERFLAKHFPEDLEQLRSAAAGGDTFFGLAAQETHIEFRARQEHRDPPPTAGRKEA